MHDTLPALKCNMFRLEQDIDDQNILFDPSKYFSELIFNGEISCSVIE